MYQYSAGGMDWPADTWTRNSYLGIVGVQSLQGIIYTPGWRALALSLLFLPPGIACQEGATGSRHN